MTSLVKKPNPHVPSMKWWKSKNLLTAGMYTNRIRTSSTDMSIGATTTPDCVFSVALFMVPELDVRIVQVGDDQAGGINGLEAAGIFVETSVKNSMALRACCIIASLNSGGTTLLEDPIKRACFDDRCHGFWCWIWVVVSPNKDF